jgi:hypothetical protein
MLVVNDRSGNGYGVGFVYRGLVSGEMEDVGLSQSVRVLGEFNASLSGTFDATLDIVRSFDGGLTWAPLTALGTSFEFTAPCQEMFEESEPGVLYAWRCKTYNSGTIEYRISQ